MRFVPSTQVAAAFVLALVLASRGYGAADETRPAIDEAIAWLEADVRRLESRPAGQVSAVDVQRLIEQLEALAVLSTASELADLEARLQRLLPSAGEPARVRTGLVPTVKTLGTGSIIGRVTDATTGLGLSDVFIDVQSCAGTFVAWVRSDTNGEYATPATLPPGTYLVRTSNSAGYIDQVHRGRECSGRCDMLAGTAIRVENEVKTIDFALRPGGLIKGRITNAKNGDADLDTAVDIYDARGIHVTYGYTFTDGVYRTVQGLLTGTYYAKTRSYSHLVDALYSDVPCGNGRCDVTSGTPIHVTVGHTTGAVDFALASGAWIEGTVTDRTTGAPEPGLVDVYDARGVRVTGGTTDSLGRYEINGALLPGDYRVSTRTRGTRGDASRMVTVPAVSTAVRADFALDAGGAISGVVKDARTGAALSDAWVFVVNTPAGLYLGGVRADADGTYTFPRLASGTYRVQARGPAEQGYVEQENLEVTVVAPEVSRLDIALAKGGRISGRIRDAATGAGMNGVYLNVYDSSGAYVDSVRTDCRRGAYDVSVPHGTYFVTADLPPRRSLPYGYRYQLFDHVDCPRCDVRRGVPVTVAADTTTKDIDFTLVRRRRNADYDRDGRGDLALYYPHLGAFSVLVAGGGETGIRLDGEMPAPNDYDGDGKTDACVYDPKTALWRIRQSSNEAVTSRTIGGPGYEPVRGDFNGDGRADPAVYQRDTGKWILQIGTRTEEVVWRGGGSVPVPADYDGDGRTDVAVYNPALGGRWWIRRSGSGATETFTFGGTGRVPAIGDFDGDGTADLGTFDRTTGVWSIRRSSDEGLEEHHLRAGRWSVPRPLDYDGDGRTDLVLYDPSALQWHVRTARTGTVQVIPHGRFGAVPLD